MKKAIVIIVIIIVLAGLGFYFFNMVSTDKVVNNPETPEVTTEPETTEPETTEPETDQAKVVIGKSAGGSDIEAYNFGTGDTHLLFVGGIHGGYEWNTSLVAYELIDYLEENSSAVPSNVKVTVIPVLNPDGLLKVVGTTGKFSKADVSSSESVRVSGRFNTNGVDLNRNFDCDWQSEGVWKDQKVDAGDSVFSEPESQAMKNYIESNTPDAVVVYYSAVGGVFASNCHNGVLDETLELTNVYADASGYKAYEEFDFYEITGDMTNWLAKIGVPATSVLLTTHDDVEWEKNKKGIEAVLNHYSN